MTDPDLLARLEAATADDLRKLGWTVAVHNDYRQLGGLNTFWLLTKNGRALKREGRIDAEALNQIRAALRARAEQPTEE